MAKFKVRDGFVVHLGNNRIHPSGEIIDLTPFEADLVAHQIEPIPTTKTKEKTTNDGTNK